MSSTFRQLILLILLRETVCQKLLSLNKGIRASSTEPFPQWDTRNAVDGNLTNTPFECECCASTRREPSPWYELDLGREFLIERIDMLGNAGTKLRWHRLADMEIFLAAESEIENKTAIKKIIGRPYNSHFTLEEKRESRYVTVIHRNIDNPFVVCELSVYGDCVDGEFGPDCGQRCHCEEKTCNKTTGVCPSGKCLPGFTGPACDKACEQGRYGNNCTEECGHCKDNALCDFIDGSCPNGCKLGYGNNNCNTPCPDGHFGVNCSSNCGNCLNGTSCTKNFGVCIDGCESGFIPPLCFEDNAKASCPDVKLYQVATAVGGASTLIMIVVMVAGICYVIRLRKRYGRQPTRSPLDISGPYELPIRSAVESEHQYGQTGPIYEEAESSYEIPK